jgi:uncharacterized protein YqcC (DUF446 family)
MGSATIQQQMILIEEAMKAAGFWSDAAPDWVSQYQSDVIPDIWQWLQFVYIPLRIKGILRPSVYLAPQVTAHTGVTLSEESLLLQRIVELDSLTPMLPQS